MGADPVVVLYASISVLNLMQAATAVQGHKERCNMGSFGLVEDQSRCSVMSSKAIEMSSPVYLLGKCLQSKKNESSL